MPPLVSRRGAQGGTKNRALLYAKFGSGLLYYLWFALQSSRGRAYLDVRVFNPFAVSNRRQSLPSVYRAQENKKKRQYSERVREVEHASFTPLVLSATGG